MQNTIALIPAYNEEKLIAGVISKVKKYVSNVIVVDNNSRDNTAVIARQCGATVLVQQIRGQGAATQLGWNNIRWNGVYDCVVTLDGDGQHNPDEIPLLIEKLRETGADIIVGSRFINKYEAPRYRKFGIDVITWLYNFGHRYKMSDSQCCFRVYSKKAVNTINIEDNGFGFSTETLIKARKYGLKIVEVPVSCIYHGDLKLNSTLNPVRHGLGVAWKTIWWRLKVWN